MPPASQVVGVLLDSSLSVIFHITNSFWGRPVASLLLNEAASHL